jgi:uncharacterized protein YutE (UPF0331/DUF86 family)
MRLDLYQAETARIAAEQCEILDETRSRLLSDKSLSRLEQSGVLHILQVLVENAIGKAKHLLKAAGEPVPVSAYDAFASLHRRGDLNAADLEGWNTAIGLRNRIVHDYMNIDMELVLQLVREAHYRFIAEFLRKPLQSGNASIKQ